MNLGSFYRENGILACLAICEEEQSVILRAITIVHIALIDVGGIVAVYIHHFADGTVLIGSNADSLRRLHDEV
jgi:hypothetical protein